MNKRGQIQLSFGMIFSIIIIIATIAVAWYVISHFISVSECTDIGLFYRDLQGEIDKAWNSPLYQGTFEGSVPGSISSVCFGNLELAYTGAYDVEYEMLQRSSSHSDNVFLYPPKKACGASVKSAIIDHTTVSEFFCVPVVNEKISVKLSKGTYDPMVTIS